jgi:hypothetical protein
VNNNKIKNIIKSISTNDKDDRKRDILLPLFPALQCSQPDLSLAVSPRRRYLSSLMF